MAKITPEKLNNRGFGFKSFGMKDESAWPPFLAEIITEQSASLRERVGASIYDASTSNLLIDAETCLCVADLCQRRINFLDSDNNPGEGTFTQINSLEKTMARNNTKADGYIDRIISGDTQDDADGFSSAVVVSSHFPSDNL